MTNLTEQTLLDAVRRGLNHSAKNLDVQTQRKLRQARLRVLPRGQSYRQWSDLFSLPSLAGGFVMAAVITLAITLGVLPNMTGFSPVDNNAMAFTPEPLGSGLSDTNAMEVIMSGEDMDFLENLDMYEWLEAEYG